MQNYTVTTAAREETGLTLGLNEENVRRVTNGQPQLSRLEYVNFLVHNDLISFFRRRMNQDGDSVSNAYGNATDDLKQQVRDLLGVTF